MMSRSRSQGTEVTIVTGAFLIVMACRIVLNFGGNKLPGNLYKIISKNPYMNITNIWKSALVKYSI